MTNMTEIKKEKDTNIEKRTELKVFSAELPKEPQSQIEMISEINAILSQYNTKIRTSKTIEITGTGRLKLNDLGSVPTTCLVGEVISSGGKLYICSAVDTFTIVGTQT